MSYIDFLLGEIFLRRKTPPNPIKDKIGEELAKKYNLKYIGWQSTDGESQTDGLMLFNDPSRNNTTIAAKSEEDLKK